MKDYSFSKSKKRVDGKKFILIVDDDKNIRFVLKTLLEKNNYQVETTGNLSGLRRVLSDLVPDLIITDVKLPDGNFFDEISEIKWFSTETLDDYILRDSTVFSPAFSLIWSKLMNNQEDDSNTQI